MTDSTNEKPTPRQNRLNPQAENFDFELVEVKVDPEQVNPTPITLDGFIDDDGDNLLNDEQQSPESSSVANGFTLNKPNTLIPPAQVVPEIKTSFYVDYFDKRKEPETPISESASVEQTNQSKVDNWSQEVMSSEHKTEIADEAFDDEDETLDSDAPIVNGAGMAVAVLSQFKSKQESINKQQEKLIQDFSKKMKTATAITYTAVFFGVVALTAATAFGVMLLKTKSDVSDLVGTTMALKDNIRNIAKAAPSDDLEGSDPSIDQLNQKVDDVMQQLNQVTTLQNKVSSLEKTVAAKSVPSEIPESVEKTAGFTTKPLTSSIPAPIQKTTVILPKHATTPVEKTVAKSKPEIAKPLAAATTEKKATVDLKNAKKIPAEPVAPVIKVATVKPENKPPVAKKATETAATQLPANDINKVINTAAPNAISTQSTTSTSTTVSTPAAKPQVTKTQPQANTNAAPQTAKAPSPKPQTTGTGNWTVNLGSSNKLEDAKNTAARFAQKGIPVSVSSVTVKNETRYRLQVKGFKTKEEATAYGNKAKDALKLDSVWVNP